MACTAKYKFNTHFAGKIMEWFIFKVDSPIIAFRDNLCWDSSAVLWLSHSDSHNAICGSASDSALSLRLPLTERDAVNKYTGTKDSNWHYHGLTCVWHTNNLHHRYDDDRLILLCFPECFCYLTISPTNGQAQCHHPKLIWTPEADTALMKAGTHVIWYFSVVYFGYDMYIRDRGGG